MINYKLVREVMNEVEENLLETYREFLNGQGNPHDIAESAQRLLKMCKAATEAAKNEPARPIKHDVTPLVEALDAMTRCFSPRKGEPGPDMHAECLIHQAALTVLAAHRKGE